MTDEYADRPTRYPEGTAEAVAHANEVVYDAQSDRDYVKGAPHLRHASLQRLYNDLASDVVLRGSAAPPRVLDLGAGEGSATHSFLRLGAHVTAVDISAGQLSLLRKANVAHGRRLVTLRADALGALTQLREEGARFDVVAAISFLHHVPDYLAVIAAATDVVDERGVLFTFQDPLSSAEVTAKQRFLSRAMYFSWRLLQDDVRAGFGRWRRRRRGIWLDDCEADVVEFHMLRDGVDHAQIESLLKARQFSTQVIRYFSTQAPLWQSVGERLGLRNSFALVAQRNGPPSHSNAQ